MRSQSEESWLGRTTQLHWMKFWIYMGVKMIVKVVQIQRQTNVNVVKPGFTTSAPYVVNITFHQPRVNLNQIRQSRSEHAFTMP